MERPITQTHTHRLSFPQIAPQQPPSLILLPFVPHLRAKACSHLSLHRALSPPQMPHCCCTFIQRDKWTVHSHYPEITSRLHCGAKSDPTCLTSRLLDRVAGRSLRAPAKNSSTQSASANGFLLLSRGTGVEFFALFTTRARLHWHDTALTPLRHHLHYRLFLAPFWPLFVSWNSLSLSFFSFSQIRCFTVAVVVILWIIGKIHN